jgi:hypothetical protein
MTGAFDAGVSRLEELIRRVPFDTQNPLYYSLIALGRLLDGDTAKAVEVAREGLERNPLGAWNALVYAVTIGDDRHITTTDEFQRILKRIDLDAAHFAHFPFRDAKIASLLSSRARAAGVPWAAAN